MKNQKSKIRNQKSKIENRKSKIKNRKSKIKNQKSKKLERWGVWGGLIVEILVSPT